MNYFSTNMTEIKRIPAEVCKDLHENIGNNCWQKPDCGFTREHAEISSIGNIPTRDKEVVSISVINVTFIAALKNSFRESDFLGFMHAFD
jgi:hypothetical protein